MRTIKANTSAFIMKLTEYVNSILSCYYEEAPSTASLPYAIVNGIYVSDLATGDLVPFYIDIWADEKNPNATEQLEGYCDTLRNALNNKTLIDEDVLYAHIGFENQSRTADTEFDLSHRKLSFEARIFYVGGSNL